MLVKTKIIPEKNLPNIVSRERVINILEDNREKDLISIKAGAGYGKSTLAKEFLIKGNKKYSWYKIDDEDNNFYVFFSYLIKSVNYINAGFGENTSKILDSIKDRINFNFNFDSVIGAVGGTFINDIVNNVKDEFYLVLDDFHLLPKDEWVSKTLLYLIENTPENFHIILTTRESLPFDSSKLKAKRRFVEITDKELKFSDDEVKELARSLYNKELSDSDLKIINEKFGGWITGLHLFFQSPVGNIQVIESDEIIPDVLFNFFAEDIFSRETKAVQKFLIDTCILDDFSAETCDFLLDKSNSERILEGLFERNVFIQKSEIVSNGKMESKFDYQLLFKKFLLLKFNGTVSEANRKKLYKKVAGYYILKDDYSSAIKHYLLSGDFKKGIELIIINIDREIQSGRLMIADKWISMIPQEVQADNPYILFVKGILAKYLYGDFEEALNIFQDVLKLFKKSGDIKFIFKSSTLIAELLIYFGRYDKAINILEALQKKKIDPASKANLLRWLGFAYYSACDYDTALKIFSKALEMANRENLKRVKYNIFNDLGNIYLIQGEFSKSLFYYENVIKQTDHLYNKFQTLTNLVQLYAHSGKYEKAVEVLAEAEEIESTFPSPFFKINYLLAEAHLSFMTGDFEKAVEVWEKFLLQVSNSSLTYYNYLAYSSIASCYYYLKDFAKSEEYYKLSNEYVEELNETEKLDNEFCISILMKEMDSKGSYDKMFMKAYKFFESNNMIYNKVQAAFQLADYHYKNGNPDKAKEYLAESFKISYEKEYISLFQSELLFNRDLFDFAVRNNICADFIRNIYANIFDLRSSDRISDRYRERLAGEIDNLVDVSVDFFGELKVKIRGNDILDSEWGTRKDRKLIFAYIILYNATYLTKDKLIDVFFQKSSPENAENRFYQLISNIRAVIKKKFKLMGLPKEESVPGYIVYSDKVIRLDDKYMYRTDVREFEKIYKEVSGKKLPPDKSLRLMEKAIDMYKGQFLEGYYQPWCEEERVRLHNMYISMLNEVIEMYKEKGDYENVKLYGEKLLLVDELEENVYINLIESEVRLNNKLNATLVYNKMKKKFKRELDCEPSADAISKIEVLLA